MKSKEKDTEGVFIRPKIITMGDGAVGKTSIVRRYLGWGFHHDYLPTVGANFYQKKSKYTFDMQPFSVEFNVWDISGQPKYNNVRGKYYLKAEGAIVVFDITRDYTATHTKNWIAEFYRKIGSPTPVVLLGNKVDLRGTEDEEVPPEEGARLAEELSEEYGLEVPYLETSAKTNKNLDDAFKHLAAGIARSLGILHTGKK